MEVTFKDHQVQQPNHFRANEKLRLINEGIKGLYASYISRCSIEHLAGMARVVINN